MLKKLFVVRVTVLLMVVLALLTGAAVFLGHQQPVSARMALLHLTDCRLPCWIGIVSGQTSLDAARLAIKKVYSSYTVSEGPMSAGILPISIQQSDHDLFVVVVSIYGEANGTTVSDIIFVNTLALGKVTFGDIVSLLGPPDRVQPAPPGTNRSPTLLYDVLNFRIGFGVTAHYLSQCGGIPLDMEIMGLGIDILPPIRNSSDGSQPWRGFRGCYF